MPRNIPGAFHHYLSHLVAIPGRSCNVFRGQLAVARNRKTGKGARAIAVQTFSCPADDVWARRNCFKAADIAAGAFDAFGIDGHMTELAREAGRSTIYLSVHDQPGTDPGTKCDEEHLAMTSGGAGLQLAVSCRVCVIIQRNR
jgi:hypothetical protein